MPQRNNSWDDQAAGQTAGCIIVLLLAGIYFLFQAFRPRPQPYKPLSPALPHEGRATNQQGMIWFLAVGASLCGFLLLYSRDGSATVFLALGALGFGSAALLLRTQATSTDESSAADFQIPPHEKAAVYRIYATADKAEYVSGSKLIQSLLSTVPMLTFEIEASSQGIAWRIVDPTGTGRQQVIIDRLRSHNPNLMVEVETSNTFPKTRPRRLYRQIRFFGLANEYPAPIALLSMLKDYDPLETITTHMGFVQADKNERVTYSLMVFTATIEAKTKAAGRIKEGMLRPLSTLTQDHKGNAIVLDERILSTKLSGPLYHAFLAVTVETETQNRISELLASCSEVTQFSFPAYNHLRPAYLSTVHSLLSAQDDVRLSLTSELVDWVRSQNSTWRDALLVLSPDELASLWHLPNERFSAPTIAWAEKGIPREFTAADSDAIVLGDAVQYGRKTPAVLALKERATHQYVVGKTNMGKSTLLHGLIHQDIDAGRGVVVLDPHGKLISDVLAYSIPAHRIRDVVLLDCGDTAYPVPLNPFRRPQGISRDSTFDFLYWTLKKIYEGIWLEGRTDLAFRNVLQALLCDSEATPLDIRRMFTDATYRDSLIATLKTHPYGSLSAIQYWRDYTRMTRGQQAEIASPILSRTGAFLGTQHLENMTCHPETVDWRTLLDKRKIVLVDLSGDAVRTEAGNLGAIVLSALFMASESLGFLPDGAMPRTCVYVDEVQRILSTPLPDILAQARKFGLSLTLAHQYLSQLADPFLQGILGNIGTLCAFEVGDDDARKLARYTEPDIPAEKIMNLGAYHVAVKSRAQGKTLPAFLVSTRPAPRRQDGSARPEDVRRVSRDGLGLQTAEAVRAHLLARYADPQPTETAPMQPTEKPVASGDGLGDYE